MGFSFASRIVPSRLAGGKALINFKIQTRYRLSVERVSNRRGELAPAWAWRDYSGRSFISLLLNISQIRHTVFRWVNIHSASKNKFTPISCAQTRRTPFNDDINDCTLERDFKEEARLFRALRPCHAATLFQVTSVESNRRLWVKAGVVCFYLDIGGDNRWSRRTLH